ncbi:MAG: deoxyribose-phosphate aldolase [Coriobacteriia bacterium]|nr:deoxyribose-phosphate aldolase [Coriobacteriia bacterium]
MSTSLSHDLAGSIESTLLRYDASEIDIDELCTGAIWFRFAGVCVFPEYVSYAAGLLANVACKVVTVVNFPTGDFALKDTLRQMRTAVSDGADEIDYVLNIPAALKGDWQAVAEDVKAVVDLAHANEKALKVILETCLLTHDQKVKACLTALDSGADYVKTSTGFSTGGATVDDVRLMRATVGDQMGIKAAGGIRDRETAFALLDAGANRLGTSSALAIIGAIK